MRMINLTTHPVTVYRDGQPLITFAPSGSVARLTEELGTTWFDEVNRDPSPEKIAAGLTRDDVYASVPMTVLRPAAAEVTGLPEEGPHIKAVNGPNDTYDLGPSLGYIVSRLVAERLPGRTDLFCPGPEIRDELGAIIGCAGLYAVRP